MWDYHKSFSPENRMRPWFLALAAALLGSSAIVADNPAPASTAQEGQNLPGGFNAWAVTGERAQHFHDFVTEYGLNPVVGIIALQAPTSPQDPLAVLLQKLNGMVVANKDAKLGAYAIFLNLDKSYYQDKDHEKKMADIEGLAKQLTLTNVWLGMSYPDYKAVKEFGIVTNDDPVNMIKKHQVTVLVYHKQKVSKRFVFTEDKKLDDAAIRDIFAAAEKMLPPK
jgi:hypothetical protein